MEKLQLGDIILYHAIGEDDAKFDGKYGKITHIMPVYDPTDFHEVIAVCVRFDFEGRGEEIKLPDDIYENHEKYCEVVYHSEIDDILSGASETEIDDWVQDELDKVNKYDRSAAPVERTDDEEVKRMIEDADKKFQESLAKMRGETEEAVNTEYQSREEIAEDLFTDKTAERLKALREKYNIPEPEKEIKEIISEEREEKD